LPWAKSCAAATPRKKSDVATGGHCQDRAYHRSLAANRGLSNWRAACNVRKPFYANNLVLIPSRDPEDAKFPRLLEVYRGSPFE